TLDEIEEPNCSFDAAIYNAGTLPRCPTEVGRYATPILMGIYVLFVNVLLLNLLIAMFSFSIQRIQDRTDQHWNFQLKRFSNERQLIQWENVIADAYLHKLEMMDLERLEIKMQLTHE
ncbi:hypothetical protein AM593_02250, partial [Mytilus galloprovincialis]